MLLDARTSPTSRPITAAGSRARWRFSPAAARWPACAGRSSAVAAGADARPEEIRVEPGLAVDRLGRLIEIAAAGLPAPATLVRRPQAATTATRCCAPPTPTWRASSRRAAGSRRRPLPARAVVADVFVRFVACEQRPHAELRDRPVRRARCGRHLALRDAYELLLVPRAGLDDSQSRPAAAARPRPGRRSPTRAERGAPRLQDAVLDGYPAARHAPAAPASWRRCPSIRTGSTAAPSSSPACFIPVGAADPPRAQRRHAARRQLAPALPPARWR